MKSAIVLLALVLSTSAHAALTCGNDDTHESGTWYVGQPFTALDAVNPIGAVWCEASGKELSYIEQNFTGLRLSRYGTYVQWTGDDAAFILQNI